MKTAPKIKGEKSSPKLKTAKGGRRAAPKPVPSNGKHPPATYEHAPIGIVESSLEGKFVNVNEEFCRVVDYEKEEIIGCGLKDFTHEDDYPIDIKMYEQLIAGKIPFYRFEKRYVRKNGEHIWVELTRSIVKDAKGKPLYTIGVVLDISERKHVERVLRESVEHLRLATEAARMFTWEWDFQKQIYKMDDNFEKVIGFSAGLLPQNQAEAVFKLSPPEDMQAISEAVKSAIESRSDLHSLQYRMIDPVSRQMVWLEANGKVVYDEEGRAVRMFGVAQNITKNKESEEALRESEQRFRAILRQATAGIVRKDAEGRFLFVNQAFCNMLGYTEADLIGKTVWEFMYENDIAENKRLYQRMMVEGIPFKLEKRLIREDGSVIWLDASISPIMDVTGRPQSTVAVEVDITGRKQAEEALQQLNIQLEDRVLSRTAKLRAVNQTLREEIAERKRVEEALRQSETTARLLLNTAPDVVVITDESGVILHANTQTTNLFGYEPDEVLGKPIEILIPERFHHQHMHHRHTYGEQRVKRMMGLGMELFGRHKEGGEFPVDVMLTPVSNIPEWNVMVTIRDNTQRKEMESALRKSHERLRILSRRLVEVQEEERRALARELHDRVGQTLAALNINLIIINSQLSGDAVEQIGTRLNDSMKLVAETIALVRDVMTDLRPAVLDDYGLEAALESHLAKFMSRYEIESRFEKPSEPTPRLGPSIEMTFLRIAQEALMNIARHAQATKVNLTLRQETDTICLTIQDNGIGIASWQEANRPGSHGLTIMRERAEAFDGNLRVRSVAGQGTTIEVSIPFRKQDQNKSVGKESL